MNESNESLLAIKKESSKEERGRVSSNHNQASQGICEEKSVHVERSKKEKCVSREKGRLERMMESEECGQSLLARRGVVSFSSLKSRMSSRTWPRATLYKT